MQWKSIADEGMPDAKKVVLSKPSIYREGWLYVIGTKFGSDYDDIEGLKLKLTQSGDPMNGYTHYLILEPPEVE